MSIYSAERVWFCSNTISKIILAKDQSKENIEIPGRGNIHFLVIKGWNCLWLQW